jgi:hypothetical protein
MVNLLHVCCHMQNNYLLSFYFITLNVLSYSVSDSCTRQFSDAFSNIFNISNLVIISVMNDGDR